jgi:hypothetical protein
VALVGWQTLSVILDGFSDRPVKRLSDADAMSTTALAKRVKGVDLDGGFGRKGG